MIRLLQWLIFGHIHEWETIDKGKLQLDGHGYVGEWYVLRCKKCGNVKETRLR